MILRMSIEAMGGGSQNRKLKKMYSKFSFSPGKKNIAEKGNVNIFPEKWKISSD